MEKRNKKSAEKYTDIVMKFIDKSPGSGFIITVDSLFGCLSLLKKIIYSGNHGIMACRGDRPSFIFRDYL